MMHIPVRRISEGLHPKEVVIAIDTKDGLEELSVDGTSLIGETLGIGWPVGQEKDFYLVELPRETFRGYWRVWISKDAVKTYSLKVGT